MKTKNKHGIIWLILLLAYSALIYILSSGPVHIPGPGFPLKDKLLHALAYGLMAWLAWLAASRWPVYHPEWWAGLYAMGYGATDEWHQYFVPGRQCDFWDWVADSVGAALVILIITLSTHWPNRTSPSATPSGVRTP